MDLGLEAGMFSVLNSKTDVKLQVIHPSRHLCHIYSAVGEGHFQQKLAFSLDTVCLKVTLVVLNNLSLISVF